jgi:hypothetical protein
MDHVALEWTRPEEGGLDHQVVEGLGLGPGQQMPLAG